MSVENWGDACLNWDDSDVYFGVFEVICEPIIIPDSGGSGFGRPTKTQKQKFHPHSGETHNKQIKIVFKMNDLEFIDTKFKRRKIKIKTKDIQFKIKELTKLGIKINKD